MALFFTQNGIAKKIPPVKVGLEKDVQKIFEKNLEEILDITFLASEYSTSFGGRMDTLGIDHNGSPVIIEYKRGQNDSVINQGLSYLRWLLDHKADFEALMHRLNITIPIDWASPRVICVAESYNKFDLDTADLLPMDTEDACAACKRQDRRTVSLREAQSERVLPVKSCDRKHGCRCVYAPQIGSDHRNEWTEALRL